MKRARPGFSLIELLVVVAIITTLVAMLLPAVQKARESAQRVVCMNNLKQTALAMHVYHDANQMFPQPRYSNPQYGHMVPLLPYVEQALLGANFDITAPGGFADPLNQPAANMPVKIIHCPSNPTSGLIKMRKSSQTGTKYGDFITAGGTTTDPNNPAIMTGYANDYWVNHAINKASYTGTGNPTPVLAGDRTLASITDGTSNTTLLLEHAGYDVHYVKGVGMPMPATDVTLDQPGAWGTWAGWCAFQLQGYQTYGPSNPYPTNVANQPPGTDCAINCNNSQGVFGFHVTGANIAMADGSVHYFTTSLSVKTLIALATKNGGETLDFDAWK